MTLSRTLPLYACLAASLALTGCGAGERLSNLNPFQAEETDDQAEQRHQPLGDNVVLTRKARRAKDDEDADDHSDLEQAVGDVTLGLRVENL